MKRLPYALLATIALVGILAVSVNTLVARMLDAALPRLLESALGMPVQLAPLTVNLMRMQASSSGLLLGDTGGPAVRVRDIAVRLSPDELFAGNLRLVSVSANTIDAAFWRWPVSTERATENYLWLDAWLPQEATVETLLLVPEHGTNTAMQSLRWLRDNDAGATLSGRLVADRTTIALHASVPSLQPVLALERAEFSARAEAAGEPDSAVDLRGQLLSRPDGGYALEASLAAKGLQARVAMSSALSWQLANESDVEIKEVRVDELRKLATYYFPSDDSRSLHAMLGTEVPRLALPVHTATIRIVELQRGGLALTDAGVTLHTHASGFAVKARDIRTPAALLNANATVDDRDGRWHLELEARLDSVTHTRDSAAVNGKNGESSAGHTGAHWQFNSGSARLAGSGDTWGALLYSLAGDIRTNGTYAADSPVPVALQLQLDNRPGEFTLENILLQLGAGTVTGSASISGSDRRRVSLALQANDLDLALLTEPDAQSPDPASDGIHPMDLPVLFENLDIDASLAISELQGAGIALAGAEAKLTQDDHQTALELQARDPSGGEYALTLDAGKISSDGHAFTLRASLDNADLPALLQAPGLAHARTSGSLTATSSAADSARLIEALAARADFSVELRADNNWQRKAAASEAFRITADARLATERERISGLEIDNLRISGDHQDLTGRVDVTVTEPRALHAVLASRQLNVDRLLALLPAPGEAATGQEHAFLQMLRGLGQTHMSYSADQLVLRELPLDKLRVELAGGADSIAVDRLDLHLQGGQLASKGSLRWQGEEAILDASARLENMNLDQFLLENPAQQSYPVSGRIRLNSKGGSDSEFLSNLNGHIQLTASDGSTAGKQARRHIEAQVSRLPGGARLHVHSLVWGDTDLVGRLSYLTGDPPRLAVEIDGGTLSLAPWTEAVSETAIRPRKNAASTVTEVAAASAGFIGDFVLSPLRFLAGDEETSPGERVFSAEPLPLDTLDALDLAVSGRLDTLNSALIDAGDISFDIRVKERALSATINAGALNGGQGDIDLAFNAGMSPPQLTLVSNFTGTRGPAGKDSFPSSGFLSLSSEGRSSAELAANSAGLFYLEMGRGPLDYSAGTLLNADMATALVRALIPGMEKQRSDMECGIALFQIQNGIVATPYGMVARTSLANLVGRAQVDLQKEQLRIKLDSRSRKGVGLSVSSIFANTIEIRGPLSAPEIEPDTASILWRSWAAVMTAGLSVVGESVLKRALASDNPCDHAKQLIIREFCPSNATAAAAPLVCPGQAFSHPAALNPQAFIPIS